MTKETKAKYMAQLEDDLAWLDMLLNLNQDENHRVSLLEQYRKTAKDLADLRDEPTSN
jgi:hypothetical protein